MRRMFGLEEKIKILNECKSDGMSVTIRKYDKSSTLYYQWLEKYETHGIDGLKNNYTRTDSEIKRLEQENLSLKKLLADKELQIQMQQELLKKSEEQRRKRRN